jgi:hypothetical protein
MQSTMNTTRHEDRSWYYSKYQSTKLFYESSAIQVRSNKTAGEEAKPDPETN